jgi:hypothetical protein
LAVCACCSELLPEPAQEGELCAKCIRAIESGIDEGSPSPEQPTFARPPRPLGVTLLAIWNYFGGAVSIAFGLVALAGSRPMEVVVDALGHPGEDFSTYTFGVRLTIFGICAGLVGPVCYLIGRGLWRTKNWARQVTIAFSVLDLVLGGSTPEIWSRIISVITMWYLLTPGVKAAFGIPPAGQLHPSEVVQMKAT